ncbi:MAG: NAD(P)/FAD-dependent oxidoreductase, partial [Pseudomonadales bacterium]
MSEDHSNSATETITSTTIDAAIVGGGIAGLWLLNLLRRKGYSVLLFEADRIGCGQTLSSQGMIHGGLKYALSGSLTGASEAIASMPARWRDSLSGKGDVDLSGLEPLSDKYYMFAEASSLGRLTSFFASKLLRGRIQKLAPAQFPDGLSDFDGVVYELDDFVLDTQALLERLLEPVCSLVYNARISAGDLRRTTDGWRLDLGSEAIIARQLILAAGAGTGKLLGELGFKTPRIQLRPLHQVVARHPDLHPLYAHCLTGLTRSEPRITITTHTDRLTDQHWLWYLGGQLATKGADLNSTDQKVRAYRELTTCVPWIDWDKADLQCLRIDRAEPAQDEGKRPDEAYVEAFDHTLVCLPTKLSLA